MMNKRGQNEMTLGTIVSIVLLLLLLVLVIFSVTSSGRDFWAKTLNLKGGTTLDSAIQGCNVAVAANAVDSFCTELKSVTINGKSVYVTCEYLAGAGRYSDKFDSVPSCEGTNKRLVENCKALKKTNIKVNGYDINSTNGCEQLN